jgi:iron complex transport system ATP-binding protein
MLACHGLTLTVPGKTLIRNLDLVIRPGECWALLGRNGSGKSTLLHALGALASPAAGSVSLDGAPVDQYRRRTLAQKIGVLLQTEDAVFWGSVLEYVLLGRHPHSHSLLGFSSEDEAIAGCALNETDLQGLGDQAFATLSGGERQRARIAQVLAQQPHYLLLDEPLQHLDLKHQIQALSLVRRLAKNEGRAIVMVLHELLWLSEFDRALLLFDDGDIAAGQASELLTRERLERLYCCPVRVVSDGAVLYFVPGGAAGRRV